MIIMMALTCLLGHAQFIVGHGKLLHGLAHLGRVHDRVHLSHGLGRLPNRLGQLHVGSHALSRVPGRLDLEALPNKAK